jgi:hypothetical protein
MITACVSSRTEAVLAEPAPFLAAVSDARAPVASAGIQTIPTAFSDVQRMREIHMAKHRRCWGFVGLLLSATGLEMIGGPGGQLGNVDV